MAPYIAGEVALLYDINPVALRAWQRRYGLLKPQQTDDGHRLPNDADIDWIREAKRWIDNGVQVSRVKILLSNESVDVQNGWRDQQETLLTYLQNGNLHSLRARIEGCGQDYPTQTPTTHLSIPLCRRLQCQQPTLQVLLAVLNGILINYIAICLTSARKKQGKGVLAVNWSTQGTACLWLEDRTASQQGWRIDVLAHSLSQPRPELSEGRTLLVWCSENRTSAQQQQFTGWQEQGHDVFPLGI